MMRIIFAVLTAITVTLVACQTQTLTQTSGGLHARANAHLLRQDMPEAEAVSLIGNPNKISLRPCGSNTDAPWTCKIHEYTEPTSSGYFLKTSFSVFYYELSDGWYIHSFVTH